MLATALLAGCGGEDDDAPAPGGARSGAGPPATEAAQEQAEEGGHSESSKPGEDPFESEAEDAAPALRRTAREYVRAINRRDGEALCGLVAPAALRQLELPRPAGGCAAAVMRSIGRAEGPDLPWRRSRILRIGPVELAEADESSARVRLAMMHVFRGDREPSYEDDLLYLRSSGGGWEIEKPSVTFYRAIGARRIPLAAIAPPSGGAGGGR